MGVALTCDIELMCFYVFAYSDAILTSATLEDSVPAQQQPLKVGVTKCNFVAEHMPVDELS